MGGSRGKWSATLSRALGSNLTRPRLLSLISYQYVGPTVCTTVWISTVRAWDRGLQLAVLYSRTPEC